MDNLLLSLLASIGLCLILKYGSILNSIRDFVSRIELFKSLLSCSLCLGFWTGLGVGVFSNYNPLLMGFASAFVSWLSDHIILLLKERIWPT